jgi:hypothetical protein
LKIPGSATCNHAVLASKITVIVVCCLLRCAVAEQLQAPAAPQGLAALATPGAARLAVAGTPGTARFQFAADVEAIFQVPCLLPPRFLRCILAGSSLVLLVLHA